jgi:hypothetical protein
MATQYVAVIGDAVASRALPPAARTRLQHRLTQLLPQVNRRWRSGIAARFAVSLGDQFEGLLRDPRPLWDIVHWLRAELPEVDWLVAAGRGPISTPLAATAPEVDGPCFHRARAALEAAKRRRLLLAFEGFEPVAGALAGYYSALYWSWTARQRRTATLLRLYPPLEVAKRLKVHPSAVSHLATRLGWRLVSSADDAFREILAR